MPTHNLLSMAARVALGGTSETISVSASRSSPQTSQCIGHVKSRCMYSAALGRQSSRSGSSIYRNCRLFTTSTSRTECPSSSSPMSNFRASPSESYTLRRPRNGTSARIGSVDIKVFTKSSCTSFPAVCCTIFGERNEHRKTVHQIPG